MKLTLEQKIDEILLDYRNVLTQQMGLILSGRHRLDVKTADKMLIDEPKQQLLNLIQEEKIKGMLKMVETANCILQADEPAIDEIWFDLDMPDDSIMPMRQDTMLSELKHRLQALKQPNGDK